MTEDKSTQPVRLLVVDDDVKLCDLVIEYLEPEGFDVQAATDGERGLERALNVLYALIVLDVMLPGINGFEVLRRIRAQSDVPVLMLTARGEDVDRVVGLELGADDYLSKPFNPRELSARIRAILRRTTRPANGPAGPGGNDHIVVGDVELNAAARIVRRAGQIVELTSVEFALLQALLRSAGSVVPRENLCRSVLRRALTPYDRSLDMHVSNLRKKLGHRIGELERIRTLRSIGYMYTVADKCAPQAPTSSQKRPAAAWAATPRTT